MTALQDVIIVIHLLVIVALIGLILVQRSEGGALGIGGSNNFLTGRGSGNPLTRATGILAATFFATSLAMTVLARLAAPPSSILDTAPPVVVPAPVTEGATPTPDASTGTGSGTGILDELNAFTGQPSGTDTTTPAAPATTEPAAPSDTTPAPATPDTTTTAPAAPAAPQVPTTE